MPGNRLNRISGRPIFALLLRDDDVARQRRLEASAERVTLTSDTVMSGEL